MNTYPWLLFHPNIPKPLHGLAPRTLLGHIWWGKTKREAKAKLNHHCWACGIHKSKAKYHHWLEAHECYSINYGKGEVTYIGTCALCHACHNYIHDGRMRMIVGEKNFPEQKFLDILAHGEQVLKEWFQSKGWQWKGYKKADEPFQPYYELYPNLPKFSNKIEWVEGEGDPDWEDYHLILEGKRYEAKHKSYEDWLRFYQT